MVGVGGKRHLEFTIIGSGEGWLHLLFGAMWEVEESMKVGEDLDKYIMKMVKVLGLDEDDM